MESGRKSQLKVEVDTNLVEELGASIAVHVEALGTFMGTVASALEAANVPCVLDIDEVEATVAVMLNAMDVLTDNMVKNASEARAAPGDAKDD
jgi:hypothetical protein